MLKSIIFLLKLFLGNFYGHLVIFFWSHWRRDNHRMAKQMLRKVLCVSLWRRSYLNKLVTSLTRPPAESHIAFDYHGNMLNLVLSLWDQCDQIGRILEVLGNKFSCQRRPNDSRLFGPFRKTSLLCKNCLGYLRPTFWKNWATFSPTSGHTVWDLLNGWSQKSHKVNRRNLRLVVCTGQLGPPRGM